jgi:putative membrane protein
MPAPGGRSESPPGGARRSFPRWLCQRPGQIPPHAARATATPTAGAPAASSPGRHPIQSLSFAAGLLVLALAWGGAADWAFGPSFTAAMTVHMAVVAVAAPLLAWSLAMRFPHPSPLWPGPIGASAVEFAVVWGWHLPLPHDAARHLPGIAVLEQASFLAAGLLLWLACLRRGPARQGAGILALLLTSMHMTLLGVLLTLAPRPLFSHGHGAPGEAMGELMGGLVPDALTDQAIGGVIMLLFGGATYLAGGVVLAARLLNRPAPLPQPRPLSQHGPLTQPDLLSQPKPLLQSHPLPQPGLLPHPSQRPQPGSLAQPSPLPQPGLLPQPVPLARPDLLAHPNPPPQPSPLSRRGDTP